MPRRPLPTVPELPKISYDPDLERELSRAWQEPPAPPLPIGKQRPRTELDDRVDEWLRDFLGGEHEQT